MNEEWTIEQNQIMTDDVENVDLSGDHKQLMAGGSSLDESEIAFYKVHDSNGKKRLLIGALLLIVVVASIIGIVVGTSGSKDSGGTANNNSNNDSNEITAPLSPTSSPVESPPVAQPPTGDDSASTTSLPTVVAPTLAPTSQNAEQYKDIIVAAALAGGSEFDDSSSYQSKALRWIQQQTLPSGTTLTLEEEVLQLYAVVCLYYSTYAVRNAWTDRLFTNSAIPGWAVDIGWLGDPSKVCDWFGLTCSQGGKVTTITLDRMGLTGSFPAEIALLKDSLTSLDLFRNTLHNRNDEGNSFLGELTNLERLFYASTGFEHTGGIPTELGRLTKLRELDFSYTYYAGSLNGEIFKDMTELRYLSLEGNNYNSSVPEEIVTLPNLRFLFLGFSLITGNLDFIERMPALQELWIDDNPGLAGSSIPTTIGTVSSLASFSASNCSLVGTLPTELGKLREMRQLWLYSNELNGKIPSEISGMFRLTNLQLEANLLTGTMPSEICFLNSDFGNLVSLEADCDGEITCPEDCCTCCGEECTNQD